jgi:hypothetical protein
MDIAQNVWLADTVGLRKRMADARLLVAPLPGDDHELGTAVESELRGRRCKVRLHGAAGDEQLLGDLAVCQPRPR